MKLTILAFFLVGLTTTVLGQTEEFYPCKTDALEARGLVFPDEPKGLLFLKNNTKFT